MSDSANIKATITPILLGTTRRKYIDDGTARTIAESWHGGQASPLYSLASCGAIADKADLLAEIERCADIAEDIDGFAECLALACYVHAVRSKTRKPVDGWSPLCLAAWHSRPNSTTHREQATVKVITNNVPRDLIDAHELTGTERKEFDYLDWRAIDKGEESAEFFRYKGDLHYLGNFMKSDMPGWDGVNADSFFSGIAVRFVGDNERVIVGRVLI
jgi:hypothetical protein